jgi:POT family proton-dependent oligopeptide transporter
MSNLQPEPAGEFLGHPRGLAVLFATEAWERFSYFGNAALLVLYMVKYLLQPTAMEAVIGLGTLTSVLRIVFGPLEGQPLASQIFGLYTGLAYCAPVLGGLLADRLLGYRRTVVLGGVLMAIGHFMMTDQSLFLLALLMLILGIGAFKPNISTQVGALYAGDDPRRDRAYSIFYVGINLGAFLAPLICGALAVRYGWDYGFAAAGFGMLLSLIIYACGNRALPNVDSQESDGAKEQRRHSGRSQRASPRADAGRGHAARAIIGVCATAILFWAAYDQQSNTLVLWIEDFTDRSVEIGSWRAEIPSPWFLALNPLFIFLLTPAIVYAWGRQAARGSEPVPIRKMAYGCACLALANLLMVAAAWNPIGRSSPLWLLGYFLLATAGELQLAPIGLALISKRAPGGATSRLMGLWFAATLPADITAGFLGGFWNSMAKRNFFLMLALIAALAALLFSVQERGVRMRQDRTLPN